MKKQHWADEVSFTIKRLKFKIVFMALKQFSISSTLSFIIKHRAKMQCKELFF